MYDSINYVYHNIPIICEEYRNIDNSCKSTSNINLGYLILNLESLSLEHNESVILNCPEGTEGNIRISCEYGAITNADGVCEHIYENIGVGICRADNNLLPPSYSKTIYTNENCRQECVMPFF